MKIRGVETLVVVALVTLLLSGAVAAPPASAQGTTPTTIQVVYAVPSDGVPVLGRNAAIAANIVAVEAWFASQTDGEYPVFNRNGNGITVPTVVLSKTEAEVNAMNSWSFDTLVADEAAIAVSAAGSSELLVIYQGTDSSGACGYTSSLVMISVDNCNIQPTTPATFPYGITYLMAHELAHLLGAVPSCAPNAIPGGHLDGDNRDILYFGSQPRDWNNLMLDPGHDDYYGHGRTDCYDIADSPLLGTWATNRPVVPLDETCFGQVATLVGTNGDDNLVGTDGPDIIVGLGGNDVIDGLSGNDLICAGVGRDKIRAGSGNDLVDAGEGRDRMWGGRGLDTMYGMGGNDVIVGDAGFDVLIGGGGNDRLNGNGGNDSLKGGLGNDRLLGGADLDKLRGGAGDDQLWGGPNADLLDGGPNVDVCLEPGGGSIVRCETS